MKVKIFHETTAGLKEPCMSENDFQRLCMSGDDSHFYLLCPSYNNIQ